MMRVFSILSRSHRTCSTVAAPLFGFSQPLTVICQLPHTTPFTSPAMEDAHGQAVTDVIHPLLTGSSDDCRRIVETYFTPNCAVVHPLYEVGGAANSIQAAVKIFVKRSEFFKSSDFSTQSVGECLEGPFHVNDARSP